MAKPDRTWIRLAVDYDDDDAMCNVSPLAELLFVRACARSKRNRDAGAVHARALGRLTVRMGLDPDSALALAQELVREGVWIEAEGGWMIASWEKWQDADENPEEKSLRTSERNTGAAHTRWHKLGNHAERHPECPLCETDALRNADACERNANACPDTDTDTDADAYVSNPLSSSQANTTPAPIDDVRAVFDYWRERLDHPKAKLDDKRKRAIVARLKDGYTVDDLKLAVDGILLDPHKMGRNDRSRKFDDIELACRTAANVDALVDLAANGITTHTQQGRPSQHERNVSALDAWAASFDESDSDGEWTARLHAIDGGRIA